MTVLFSVVFLVSVALLVMGFINQTQRPSEVGGLVLVAGAVFSVLTFPFIICGYGILKSRRWGFVGSLVLFLLTGFGGVGAINRVISLLWLVLSIAMVVYCIQRLSGKTGTPPL